MIVYSPHDGVMANWLFRDLPLELEAHLQDSLASQERHPLGEEVRRFLFHFMLSKLTSLKHPRQVSLLSPASNSLLEHHLLDLLHQEDELNEGWMDANYYEEWDRR